jgi:hypothetical protein
MASSHLSGFGDLFAATNQEEGKSDATQLSRFFNGLRPEGAGS